MKKTIYKNPLYACGSKSYAARWLSNKYTGKIVEAKHLRSVDHHFLNTNKVFYQCKTTGAKFDGKPSNYSTKRYRQFVDSNPLRKSALKRLNSIISISKTPDYLHSKKYRSFVSNAKRHRGNTKFILVDIKSFYPSTRYKYVKDFFSRVKGLNMPPDVAEALSRLVTVPEGKGTNNRVIPQGFPTSVMISFWAYRKMFDEIYELAINNGLVFSTYVDDLTFSHNKDDFDSQIFLTELINIVSRYGHSLSESKTKIVDVVRGKPALITGVLVKRHKIRASHKLHSKMIRKYRKLSSQKISCIDDYYVAWKLFQELNGITSTINHIERTKMSKKRAIIMRYIKDNKKNFILDISIEITKKKKYSNDIYEAYKKGTIREFYQKHRKHLIA